MTKYKDLDKELVKKCCKTHAYKKNGVVRFKCEECPLRRERNLKDKEITKTLFCYFVLMSFYDKCAEEYTELREEKLQHEDEWNKFIERFETVE